MFYGLAFLCTPAHARLLVQAHDSLIGSLVCVDSIGQALNEQHAT